MRLCPSVVSIHEGIDTIDCPMSRPLPQCLPVLNQIEHLWEMFPSIQRHQVGPQTVQELEGDFHKSL